MVRSIEKTSVYRLGNRLLYSGWSALQTETTRRMVEVRERGQLSPYACKSARSLGRIRAETPCHYRTDFARDKDRILYSLYFMFLSGKTQVFSPEALPLPEKVIIHTRAFHVQKTAQIARVICRALRLNEDLAEAIALGHDLGHSPFGHKGEKILNGLSLKHLGLPFKHNRHSLRVVDHLAKEGMGLNLTHEVRDGIIRHDGERRDAILRPSRDLTLSDSEFPITLEGCVVRLADRIAYLPTDLEDGLILNLITREQVPRIVRERLGTSAGQMIDTLVRDVIAFSKGENYIAMSEPIRLALDVLYEFNYEHIYYSEINQAWTARVEECIETLYEHYTTKEKKAPQGALDAIAKMTDEQALAKWKEVR